MSLAGASLGIPILGGCGSGAGQGAGGNDGGTAVDGGTDGGSDDGSTFETSFSVVALPDTQIYAKSYPEVFVAQTQWIADNLEQEKIAFVTHLGDVVDNGPDEDQWKNAKQALSILDQAGVPYGVCLGNHDLQYSTAKYAYGSEVDNSCSPRSDFDCSAKHFVDNLGPQVFSGRPWYGGGSPTGQSSYQLIEAQGQKLLFLHLALDQRQSEQTWAQQVLDQHPDALVHLTTHRYMYDFRLVKGMPYPLSIMTGGRYTDAIYEFDADLNFLDGMAADTFFETFVTRNTNIFMVHCGHVDSEYRQVSENDAGLPVHEIMVDFQLFSSEGGEGYLRLLSFDLGSNKIQVRTYSPHTKQFRDNGAGFDASVQALQAGLQIFGNALNLLFDMDALKAQVDYWSNDPQGRQEYFDLLYGEGKRDSEFTLQLDFSAYTDR
jgi:hypothetical protein